MEAPDAEDLEDKRAPAPPPAAPPEPEKPAVAETGKLTLATVPWTSVYLDGKKLGDTPLVNVDVPAGRLTLKLKNAGAGIDQSYIVNVSAGKTTVKKLGLK